MPSVKKLGKYLNANQSYSRLFLFRWRFFRKSYKKKYPPPVWRISFEDSFALFSLIHDFDIRRICSRSIKHKQAFALFSLIHKLLSVLDANATIGARDALAL